MSDNYDTIRDEITDRKHEERRRWWQDLLIRNCGNIAHASAESGFTRAYGSALTRKFGLNAFAQALREAAGQPARGCPREPWAAKQVLRRRALEGRDTKVRRQPKKVPIQD